MSARPSSPRCTRSQAARRAAATSAATTTSTATTSSRREALRALVRTCVAGGAQHASRAADHGAAVCPVTRYRHEMCSIASRSAWLIQ
eukprot:1008312-Prymnesium_polylepis.1